MRSLALSLILTGKIKTTETRAKALRPFVERLISIGKHKNVSQRRIIASRIGQEGATRVVTKISPNYASRSSGFIRITKLEKRPSDGTRMAIIELVQT